MKIQEIKYADILIDNEIKYPNKIALCSDNQNYTYKELNRITDIYAANLLDMGIKKGDHVVIWGCNSANWFINFIFRQIIQRFRIFRINITAIFRPVIVIILIDVYHCQRSFVHPHLIGKFIQIRQISFS